LENQEDKTQATALWRYGLISELIHGSSTGLTMTDRLKQASQRNWNHPYRGTVHISGETLRHWIYRYRKQGVKSLEDKHRVDKGKSQISKALVHRLTELRAMHPHCSSETLFHILLKETTWNGVKPSRSALYRFVKNKGLRRKRIGATAIQESHAFAYENFGQLWVADFLHGPKVRVGRQMKKTYLLCIIDDATRYIVFSAFTLAENTAALIDGLSMAIRRFGIPEKFYTDNGSAFRSKHLALVAAKLGIHLPHTPAYRPQGRGKIERFFRTVRDQCLSVFKSEAFESLQLAFKEWLEAYHHRIHDSLDCSPLDKRLRTPKVTRILPDIAQIDLFFGMEERRKIQRNGTLHLLGQVFDIKNALPGTLVNVTYLPWDLSVIHVGPDKIPAKPIDYLKNAKRHEHNPIRGKEVIV
jgi:transposase InsO family protein